MSWAPAPGRRPGPHFLQFLCCRGDVFDKLGGVNASAPLGLAVRRDHSVALIPAFSITPRQRSISERILSRNSAGESDSVATP